MSSGANEVHSDLLSRRSEHRTLEEAFRFVKVHHRGARKEDGGNAWSFWVGTKHVGMAWRIDDERFLLAMRPIDTVRW